MTRRMKAAGTLTLAAGLLFAGPALAEDAASGKPEPQNVDKVALDLLNTRFSLRVTDMKLGLTWSWAAKLSGTKLPIVVWPQAAVKTVSLEFEDASLAEVLRRAEEQTGSVHRFRDGKIHLLMPAETAAFEKGEDPKPRKAEDEKEAADSGQPAPQKVGDEAELLMKKVTLELVKTPLFEALGFLSTLSQVPTECDKGIAQNIVTLKLADATMAEAMKQIKETAGGEHRVVDGTIRIAAPEQWKAIDAGTAKFEIAGTEAGGKAEQSAGWPNNLWTAHVGLVRADGEKTDLPLRDEHYYQIDGKRYSAEELQKEKPDVWKQIQASKKMTIVPSTAKVRINDKLYSLKEVQDQFPILWESLHLKIEE